MKLTHELLEFKAASLEECIVPPEHSKDSGSKAAYKMGHAHGQKKSKMIDAAKVFGVNASAYKAGHAAGLSQIKEDKGDLDDFVNDEPSTKSKSKKGWYVVDKRTKLDIHAGPFHDREDARDEAKEYDGMVVQYGHELPNGDFEKLKTPVEEANGIYEPVTDADLSTDSSTLERRGGRLQRGKNGSIRVVTDGDKTLKQSGRKSVRESEEEDNDENESKDHDTFYVAFYDSDEESPWIGKVSKEGGGKWHEKRFKGKEDSRWGQTYMSYLSPADIMAWLHKDYGRHIDIEGPFFDPDEAKEYVNQNWGKLVESASIERMAARIADMEKQLDALRAETPRDHKKIEELGKKYQALVIKKGMKVADDYMKKNYRTGFKHPSITESHIDDLTKEIKKLKAEKPCDPQKIADAERTLAGLKKAYKEKSSIKESAEDTTHSVTFTKGKTVGARSHRYVDVVADNEEDAIAKAKAAFKKEHPEAGPGYKVSYVHTYKVNEDKMEKMSLIHAFGSTELAALHDAGIKLIEKPSYWEDFESDHLKPRLVHEITLRRVQKTLGKKLKVYTGSEIYGTSTRPRGPLATVKMMPKEDMFIVDFGGGDKYLCDQTGASSYIRMWAKIVPGVSNESVIREDVCDDILEALTKAYKKITDNDAYSEYTAEEIKSVYETLRYYLKKDDMEGFKRAYNNVSGDHVDGFDALFDEVYADLGVDDYEGFAKKVGLKESVFTKYADWKEAVLLSHPAQARDIKFRGKMEGEKTTISAVVPGQDKVYGIWDDAIEEGKVLAEGAPTKAKFTSQKDWSKAAKEQGYDIESWGHGSKSAHDVNGKKIGEWVADFDCDNGVNPHGWLMLTKKSGKGESDIDAALKYLKELIADGVEYPDAEHKAATKFKVSHEQLRKAYDEQ